MKIAVLGAGVVGVCSAWYLAQAGHDVTVIDRQAGSALETSFANGGQISVGHAEPWAGPQVPRQLLAWLGRESSPLLWRLRWDPDQWRWGLAFLDQCRNHCVESNTEALVRLAFYSRQLLKQLRSDLRLEYDQSEQGILRFFTSERALKLVASRVPTFNRLGCHCQIKSASECIALEPSLQAANLRLAGGVFAPDDESGDARKFTQLLAQHCLARGVQFRYGLTVSSLHAENERITHVTVDNDEEVRVDGYVIALGSYSPLLLRSIGLRLQIYPAKGYSLTIPLAADDIVPQISLTDDEHKLVISLLGDTLRVAGTAEFNGYDNAPNPARCAAILRRVRQLFPHLSHVDQAEYWSGLRPSTPGNVPFVGATRFRNLYLNTGHGTLGWTLACGSGQLLADIVGERTPVVDTRPYAA